MLFSNPHPTPAAAAAAAYASTAVRQQQTAAAQLQLAPQWLLQSLQCCGRFAVQLYRQNAPDLSSE
jgi:hypothetical protein